MALLEEVRKGRREGLEALRDRLAPGQLLRCRLWSVVRPMPFPTNATRRRSTPAEWPSVRARAVRVP